MRTSGYRFLRLLLTLTLAFVPGRMVAAAPVVQLNATHLDFGAIPAGTRAERLLTITNSGDAPLWVDRYWCAAPYNTVDNGYPEAMYAISYQSDSRTIQGSTRVQQDEEHATIVSDWIAPGATATFPISFLPSALYSSSGVGTWTATLFLKTGTTGAAVTHSITLTGVGLSVGPRLEGLPANPISFGRWYVNTYAPSPPSHSVNLVNSGTDPLIISSIQITGDHPGDFETSGVIGCVGRSLGRQEQCSFQLRFVPKGIGPRRAFLTITTNESGGTTRTRQLEGTGAAPPPPAPHSLAAAAASATRVNLSWQGTSDNVVVFQLERKVGSGLFQPLAVPGPSWRTWADTTARPSQTYTYRIRSANFTSPSTWSDEVTVTTPSGAPEAPTNLIKTVSSATRVTLSWQSSGVNVVVFQLERKVGNGPFQLLAIPGPSWRTWIDTTVGANQTYTYRVRAANYLNPSGWSNEEMVSTPSR